MVCCGVVHDNHVRPSTHEVVASPGAEGGEAGEAVIQESGQQMLDGQGAVVLMDQGGNDRGPDRGIARGTRRYRPGGVRR